jgi:predicted GNAT superfamily acetyltransferase
MAAGVVVTNGGDAASDREIAGDGFAGPAIRPLRPDDAAWALALNARFEERLSPLDPARFEALRCEAVFAAAADGSAGFLIAFDEAARYDSPNFLWFKARYPRFAYVDRVVVDPLAGRRGVGRALYAALMAQTAASGRALVVCEVNSAPPNPESDAFHAALGFRSVGAATVGEKQVRYLLREIAT